LNLPPYFNEFIKSEFEIVAPIKLTSETAFLRSPHGWFLSSLSCA